MSDAVPAMQAAPISAGTLLRRTREAAGLHVAALAASLKVPVRKVEALEEDRYEDVGDAVFIRALASTICRTLQADAQPILDRLPQTAAPRLVRDTDGLNAPFRAPTDAAPPSWMHSLRQPVPLAVIALLIGAVVIYVLPLRQQEDTQPQAMTAAAPTVPVAMVTSAPEQPALVASQPAVAAAMLPVADASVTNAATPASTPAVSAPPAQPAQAAAAPSAPLASASGIVIVRAKGESWVEVVDAKGGVALRKLMGAGETAGASGALPLHVTIGRVDMTDVQVRGKPFDLNPVSRDNVARFEVK